MKTTIKIRIQIPIYIYVYKNRFIYFVSEPKFQNPNSEPEFNSLTTLTAYIVITELCLSDVAC